MLIAKHEIHSLSDYIDILSKYPSRKYFYRGESNLYENRQSSAIREYLKDRNFNAIELLNEFFYEVSYKLTSNERNSFIAFAQHHGIPTNLLDITSSPLVALFFACHKNNDSSDSKGYVYVHNNCGVDVSEIIEKFPDTNIVELLISDNIVFLKSFIESVNTYFEIDEFNLRKYVIQIFNTFINIYSAFNTFDLTEEEMHKIMNEGNNYQINELLYKMLMDFAYTERYKDVIEEYHNKNCESYSWSYVFMLKGILKFYFEDKSIESWIDYIPNLIYKPTLYFERGRSQSGFFLYQLYIRYYEDTLFKNVVLMQRIHYDAVIEVVNPNQILIELDNIGVNKKSIYKDFDSIAQYLYESKL